jgi:hypothetical protein
MDFEELEAETTRLHTELVDDKKRTVSDNSRSIYE